MLGYFLSKEERLRREASAWVARLEGEPSPSDREAFHKWYGADGRNAEAFDRVKSVYGSAGLLATTELGRGRALPSSPQGMPRPRYALAAAVAGLVAIGGTISVGGLGGLVPQAQAETLLFATTLGEVRQVPLPDGSRMTLDALSKAQVRMGPGERQVTLDEGRARFALARRADRPLVVEAGRTRVTADAGTFDVGFIDGNTTVRPLQGGVSVRNLTGDNTPEPVRLSAGEALDIPHSGLPSRRRYPAGSAAQWPAGRLEFADTRLDQVIAEASRYSRGSISLSTPSLAALRVTGTFRAGNLPALARSLAAAFNLRLEQTRAGHFVLQPPPTSSRVANPKK